MLQKELFLKKKITLTIVNYKMLSGFRTVVEDVFLSGLAFMPSVGVKNTHPPNPKIVC